MMRSNPAMRLKRGLIAMFPLLVSRSGHQHHTVVTSLRTAKPELALGSPKAAAAVLAPVLVLRAHVEATAAEVVAEVCAFLPARGVDIRRTTAEILVVRAAVVARNTGRPERLAGSEADPAHDEEHEESGETALN